MKKIFSFLVLLTGMTMVTSCSKNDATYTAPEILPITVADVLFGAGGGDGSIVANTTSSLIATTNGVQALTVPVEKSAACIKEIRISDHGNWRHLHWNALQSAYGESPFFEYYQADIRPFFEKL